MTSTKGRQVGLVSTNSLNVGAVVTEPLLCFHHISYPAAYLQPPYFHSGQYADGSLVFFVLRKEIIKKGQDCRLLTFDTEALSRCSSLLHLLTCSSNACSNREAFSLLDTPVVLNMQQSDFEAFSAWAGTSAIRKAILSGYANKLAARMQRHNGYKTIGLTSTMAQLHPSSCPLAEDDDGLSPEWIIYHELVQTSRTFLSKVCHQQGCFVLQLAVLSWKDDCIGVLVMQP